MKYFWLNSPTQLLIPAQKGKGEIHPSPIERSNSHGQWWSILKKRRVKTNIFLRSFFLHSPSNASSTNSKNNMRTKFVEQRGKDGFYRQWWDRAGRYVSQRLQTKMKSNLEKGVSFLFDRHLSILRRWSKTDSMFIFSSPRKKHLLLCYFLEFWRQKSQDPFSATERNPDRNKRHAHEKTPREK